MNKLFLLALLFISCNCPMEKKVVVAKSKPENWHGFVGVQSEKLKKLCTTWLGVRQLTVDPPRIVQLNGPHGCGKSTWARAFAEAIDAQYMHVDAKAVFSELVSKGSNDLYGYFQRMISESYSDGSKVKVLDVDNFEYVLYNLRPGEGEYNAGPFSVYESALLRKIRLCCEKHNAIFFAENIGEGGGGSNLVDWDGQFALSFKLNDGTPKNFEQLIQYYTVQLQQGSTDQIQLSKSLNYEEALKKLNIEYEYLTNQYPNAILKKALWDLLLDLSHDKKTVLDQKDLNKLVTDYYNKYKIQWS